MQVIEKMVPVSKLYDAQSSVCLADASDTLIANLSNAEHERYIKAMIKIDRRETLNRKDLALFDKIDALTFEHHGMCLKDSLVTKARIKACKKYGVKFIDRDALIDHMNCMLPSENERKQESNFKRELAEFFIEKLGEGAPGKLRNVLVKLDTREDLDLEDLNFLSEMESVASNELDWTIIDPELIEAIDKACKKLGIYFKNLQKVVTH